LDRRTSNGFKTADSARTKAWCATSSGLADARNLPIPEDPRPFAPVPYFWSDPYDMKIHAYGFPRGHDEARVVDGDLRCRRFIAAYGKGNRLTGARSVGGRRAGTGRW
jgi:hypothetical protein